MVQAKLHNSSKSMLLNGLVLKSILVATESILCPTVLKNLSDKGRYHGHVQLFIQLNTQHINMAHDYLSYDVKFGSELTSCIKKLINH